MYIFQSEILLIISATIINIFIIKKEVIHLSILCITSFSDSIIYLFTSDIFLFHIHVHCLSQRFFFFFAKNNIRFSFYNLFDVCVTAFSAVDRIQYKSTVFLIQHCQRKTQFSPHFFESIIFYNSCFIQGM